MSNDMPLYQCHKTVRAKPMTRGEYNTLRGWHTPADENTQDEGYLVEYPDGGKANHRDFKNYISWSPKAVFEAGYTLAPRDFKDRVRAERAELHERLEKLSNFIDTDSYKGLPTIERDDLSAQYTAMAAYRATLDRRVSRFE